ncbi:MAG: hypothetical protein QF872_10425 [Gammaproteobacteria bacterium]|nr:hypothetical protein [Gammaproteobacteria bacterium]
MNRYLPLVVAMLLGSGSVTAQNFENLFNGQRALYGAGHSFIFEGKEYTTDHPEELEAAATATADNARVLLASAKSKQAEVKAIGFDWTLTKGILKSAEKALKKGDFHKAMQLAAQAKYHARMGLAQYHRAGQDWINAVPQ